MGMYLALAALSLGIGLVLGMLGGGGAILTLPMLVYFVGLEPKSAIASSLFVVGATGLAGTVVNARAREVEWRIGGLFGGAAMAGAYLGARLAAFVPASVLMVIFGATMLVTAGAMLRRRREPSHAPHPISLTRVLVLGAAVGVLSGLVGAGGGFLIVPALALFGRLPMKRAIATSLFVITLQSFAGFAGHVGHVALNLALLATVTAASVVGLGLGVLAARRVSHDHLRRGFAVLVLVMGLFVITKQLF